MGKSIGFKSNDEGHRIEMPHAELNYLERVQRIAEPSSGWFGPLVRQDTVPLGMATGAPFEARVLEVDSSEAFSIGDIMSAKEQRLLSFDDKGPFEMANISQLIEVLAQHGEMSRVTNNGAAMLALASAISLSGLVSVPGALQTGGPVRKQIQFFSHDYQPDGYVWQPGAPRVGFLVVREAPILSPGTCPGCG